MGAAYSSKQPTKPPTPTHQTAMGGGLGLSGSGAGADARLTLPPPRQASGVGKRMAAALSLRRFRLEPSADRLRESLLLSRWVSVFLGRGGLICIGAE